MRIVRRSDDNRVDKPTVQHLLSADKQCNRIAYQLANSGMLVGVIIADRRQAGVLTVPASR